MITFTGTIETIETRTTGNNKFPKKVLFIKDSKESMSVEFRSKKMLAQVELCKVGDTITFVGMLNCHISKNSGVEYNNVIAQTILRIDN